MNIALAKASHTPVSHPLQKPRAPLRSHPQTRPFIWLLATAVLWLSQLASANAQLTVTVSGITNPSEANGTYTQDGTNNGRPEFYTSDGEGNLYWDDEDNRWELYYNGTFYDVAFYNSFNSFSPPCTGIGTWTADFGSGTISVSGDCGTTILTPGPNDAPNYAFTATTRTYSYLSGGTAIDDIEDDDDYTGPISLPFAFTFSGQTRSEIYVSSNGWITFEDPEDDENSNDAYNIMSSGMIFPLWDDIGGEDHGVASYQTTGTAPNRIFKIEWRDWAWDYDAYEPTISFQLWLYEGTNVIEFVYRQEPGALEDPDASIGIATNSEFFKVLDGTGSSPGTSTSTFYDELDAKPANDQVYRFTPPGGGGCTAPTAYNLTGGGLYCPGSPVAIGLSSSESGVTYQLVRNGSDIGSPVSGTGSGINFAAQSTPGTYSVVATRTSGGCTANMSGNASVNADNTPPAITCPGTVNVNTSAGGTGDCYGVATWTTPTPTDNCSASIQSVSHNSGSAFVKGATTVTYVAVDAAGNTVSCSFTVNVADNEPPGITCPASVNTTTSAGGTGNCAGTATWGVPTVTDNCGGSYIHSLSHPNSSAFAKGTTTVTYTAIDAASNTSTCTFSVNIADDEPPTSCPCC